jgi:hypothetical protein
VKQTRGQDEFTTDRATIIPRKCDGTLLAVEVLCGDAWSRQGGAMRSDSQAMHERANHCSFVMEHWCELNYAWRNKGEQ